MKKAPPRRGRPPKPAELVKREYLEIRIEAADKKTFRDAAELAGMDLSAWVRERLRGVAHRELSKNSRAPATASAKESS
jgi:hypothetical protein